MFIRKSTKAIAALTLGIAIAAPGQAQAMPYGSLGFAAFASDLALSAARAQAAPRRGVIVEHRYVRRGNRLHYCGCVVRQVRYY
ncbi:hypothetical protein [Methylobacterium sp. Leaf118]|uniref:hypothetical protein n=1 Tax=Methylobacterium sp. Leaf118 TaxID=2876562 RepID=UPI001E5B8F9D|nr:hypothetical protein [Methylobacterium sp. Leaf118]